jgi:phosphoribosylformylglycinamidine synthase subunit PurQ / glutaminase
VTTKVGVVQFPGTNCEQDVAWAVKVLGGEPQLLWHADPTVGQSDAVIIAGGFAHGDYLRTAVMDAVADFARSGGPVVGICNGFQILCEAGLLAGALQKNAGLKFRCQTVPLRVETTSTVLTRKAEVGQILRIPINHFEGNFVCDEGTLKELRENDQIVLRYVDNPNGSLDDIAGICNEGRNVVGLMPHPERASEAILGSTDGAVLLRSLL